jgi:hypothetical protein
MGDDGGVTPNALIPTVFVGTVTVTTS